MQSESMLTWQALHPAACGTGRKAQRLNLELSCKVLITKVQRQERLLHKKARFLNCTRHIAQDGASSSLTVENM